MSPLLLFLLPPALLTLVLLILACGRRIYPSPRLMRWAVIAAALAVTAVAGGTSVLHLAWGGTPDRLPEIWTRALQYTNYLLAALLGLVWIDAARGPHRRTLAVGRQLDRVAGLGNQHAVSIRIENHGRRTVRAVVYDDWDETFEPSGAHFEAMVEPHRRLHIDYHLICRRRGAFRLERIRLAVASPWGFWRQVQEFPVVSELHVYPDLKQVQEYALLARTDRLNLMGLRKTRRAGGESEFERLRDYTLDDQYKHLDWRATARRNRLTVRDYQVEQQQRIIFLLDCGRMMMSEANGISLLDHALNSILLMSYVALKNGDQVGLLAFSDEIHGFLPPAAGKRQVHRLLHQCFDRFPRMVESRYDLATMYLSVHSPKRALVVLFTNLIDEVNANQLTAYLTHLVGRHLPLAVILKDRELFRLAEHGLDPAGGAERLPMSLDELHRTAAACSIAGWRHQVLRDLKSKGVLLLDVFPEEMTTRLVNRYLEIKARHLL